MNLGSRGIVLSIRIAKTKALISFAVTAKLICVFVFAYVKSRFPHDAAHIISLVSKSKNFKCMATFCSCQGRFVSDQWGTPKDTFSHNVAHLIFFLSPNPNLTLILPTASWACIILMALDGCPSEMSWVEPRYLARNRTPSIRTDGFSGSLICTVKENTKTCQLQLP